MVSKAQILKNLYLGLGTPGFILLLVVAVFAVLLAVALSVLLARSARTLAATKRELQLELELEIAERRRVEDELHQAREAAEAADRAKSEFLANMSHELRTPLNSIIGFSEILVDKTCGELNPRQEKYAGNVLSSGRQLLQVINDILDLSKVEAGCIALSLAPLDVGKAISDVVVSMDAAAAQKQLRVQCDVEPDLPPVRADEAKFKRVLAHLLDNAIKFTPAGGKVRIVAKSGANKRNYNGQSIRIAVSDSGIGIEPEYQLRIFDKFEQIESAYARREKGTGLGLPLAQHFVELHGGRIWVESGGEGSSEGSTFIFELPLDVELSLDGRGRRLAPHPVVRARPQKATLPEAGTSGNYVPHSLASTSLRSTSLARETANASFAVREP